MEKENKLLSPYKSELIAKEVVQVRNQLYLRVHVARGKVVLGDLLTLRKGNKVLMIKVTKLLLPNLTPVPLAYKTEDVLIPIQQLGIEVDVSDLKVNTYRDYVQEFVTLGFLQKLHEKKGIFISESLVEEALHEVEKYKTMLTALKENSIESLLEAGLQTLTNAVKNVKATDVAIGAVLFYIAKKLWDKYSDPCNRIFRNKEEKIRCIQRAAERVATELRKEESQCNEFQDPTQKRKCLMKIEKLRRAWIQKSAELKSELYR